MLSSFGSTLRSELWRRPPWRQIKPGGGYQMGLTPVALNQWLPRLASIAEAERKAGLMNLRRLPEPVYQSQPDSKPAQQLAANVVMSHLLHYQQDPGAALRLRPDMPPLVEAAMQIPDDLCLLQLDESSQQFRLLAASLCAPSYWALSGKLGLPISAIHEPVPGLNSQLGLRMQRFFLQMPQRRCFVRRNFFVHADQEMYQPGPDTTDYARASCQDLLLRCERQGLLRLSHNLLLFSIRVELAPLAEARYWPSQARELHHLLDGLSEVQQAAFGGSVKLGAVLRFLASQTATGVEP